MSYVTWGYVSKPRSQNEGKMASRPHFFLVWKCSDNFS